MRQLNSAKKQSLERNRKFSGVKHVNELLRNKLLQHYDYTSTRCDSTEIKPQISTAKQVLVNHLAQQLA